MPVTTLSKVGNSMAVILPKALRDQAGLSANVPLNLESPRAGVIVITAVETDEHRATHFQQAEDFFQTLADKLPPWPNGKTADDLIADMKAKNADEFLSL